MSSVNTQGREDEKTDVGVSMKKGGSTVLPITLQYVMSLGNGLPGFEAENEGIKER